MTREIVNAHAASLPGAEVSDPWGGGHDAWKVGGKMFALIGTRDLGVCVKCRDIESASLLIELGGAERAPYLHRSWVLLPWGTSDDELRDRVAESYRIICSKLPRKIREDLG
ncbi:MAG TPA: MmcQ/YjbR family DNA-binding protein [Devosiaceae bacterium]